MMVLVPEQQQQQQQQQLEALKRNQHQLHSQL